MFKSLIFLSFLLTIVNNVHYTRAQEDKRKVLIKKFAQCEDHRKTDLEFVEMKITQVKRNSYLLDGRMTVHEVLGKNPTPIMVYVTAIQCTEIENPDSCEVMVQDFEVGDFCEFAAKENELWSLFTNHIKLGKCPIQKRDLICEKLPIHTDLILGFVPLDEAFFRVNLKMLEADKMLACVNIELQVTSA